MRSWSFILLALAGCDAIGGNYAGNFGARQGGVNDMRFARELVQNGKVPPAAAFLVEGMFSEHDLPLNGAPCARTFCPRAAAGFAPLKDGEMPAAWVQVGLASSINPESFQRPPLSVIFTVDVSGSMGWSSSSGDTEYPTPGQLSRRLLRGLVPQLDGDDRVALVTYGSEVRVQLSPVSGAEQAAVLAQVDALQTAGSTNMEAGLKKAIELAQNEIAAGREVRIMLFTDEQPNVGATTASQFSTLVSDAARKGIGLTIFGLGLGLGQEVMVAMSHFRGGNAFSLSTNQQVDGVIADEWPWLAVPIAFDLKLDLISAMGRTVAASYGFPGAATASSLDVSSIFLSKKRGALLVRLSGEGNELANLHLSYSTPSGERLEDQLAVGSGGLATDERGQAWAQPSVGRTVALALLVTAMKNAATVYDNDHQAAATELRAATERFDLDVQSLQAPDLQPEVDFARALLALVDSDAPQGNFYPY